MTKEMLKQCPFCGSKAEKSVSPPHTLQMEAFIMCENDGCYIQPMTRCYQNENLAIKAWNTRKERIGK